MNQVVHRPRLATGPGDGFLRHSHFQVAYVTSDLTRACEVMTQRYGLGSYKRVEGDLPTGDGYARVALAWAGATMYEIIQAEGPGGAFYTERLPAQGFAIRHHHLGYLVETQAEWDALAAKIEREGWSVPFRSEIGGFMRAIYIEAPELEHYLEYLLPEPAGVRFFEGVPSS